MIFFLKGSCFIGFEFSVLSDFISSLLLVEINHLKVLHFTIPNEARGSFMESQKLLYCFNDFQLFNLSCTVCLKPHLSSKALTKSSTAYSCTYSKA